MAFIKLTDFLTQFGTVCYKWLVMQYFNLNFFDWRFTALLINIHLYAVFFAKSLRQKSGIFCCCI
ncbi:hypothetical protein BV378_06450 [Nostoc sp. RF31YmG]|nr:hypothetical protein BV378_06450 [Nostoc sp. RF31YmG]OUL33679.1 hypothetical protein BV375_06455 [Nostoc sp. 106C]